MKRIVFSLPCLFLVILILTACTKKDNDTLSNDDQKSIVQTIFTVGADGINKSRSGQIAIKTNGIGKGQTGQYPINNDFQYDYPDGKGGNIHVIVDTGGYVDVDDNSGTCLGAFIMVNIEEQINHFYVPLANGREVYVDAYPSGITFAGNFYLLPQCLEFDSSKSSFRIEGKFTVNGIEYNIQLIGGEINPDGTCHKISGFINGISVNFEF